MISRLERERKAGRHYNTEAPHITTRQHGRSGEEDTARKISWKKTQQERHHGRRHSKKDIIEEDTVRKTSWKKTQQERHHGGRHSMKDIMEEDTARKTSRKKTLQYRIGCLHVEADRAEVGRPRWRKRRQNQVQEWSQKWIFVHRRIKDILDCGL